jgi:hypothetical protein
VWAVGFENPKFWYWRVRVALHSVFPLFASRVYSFHPHSPLGGLMGSFSFGFFVGVGDVVVIAVFGWIQRQCGSGLRGSCNGHVHAGFSLGEGGGDVSYFVARVPKFYLLFYFVEKKAVEDD